MKIKFDKPQKTKVLKAVIGNGGDGIFLQDRSGRVYYLDDFGYINTIYDIETSLVSAIESSNKHSLFRTPIYEDDSVTLTF